MTSPLYVHVNVSKLWPLSFLANKYQSLIYPLICPFISPSNYPYIDPFVQWSIQPFVHWSVHPAIHASIHLSICPVILCPLIYSSSYPYIHPSICLFSDPSINPSTFTCMSVCQSVSQSAYLLSILPGDQRVLNTWRRSWMMSHVE